MANTKKPATKTKVVAEEKASIKVDEVETETTIIPKDIDINQYVTVRNGFQGKLVYISKRSGETFVWDSFGSEQEMTLSELKDAKNSHKNFYIHNWFMFDEAWVPHYLGVANFYKHAVSIDKFDEIFKKSSKELTKIISEMSDGQKKSVAYRARQLIADKEIDSLSVIKTLEESLNIELIEK